MHIGAFDPWYSFFFRKNRKKWNESQKWNKLDRAVLVAFWKYSQKLTQNSSSKWVLTIKCAIAEVNRYTAKEKVKFTNWSICSFFFEDSSKILVIFYQEFLFSNNRFDSNSKQQRVCICLQHVRQAISLFCKMKDKCKANEHQKWQKWQKRNQIE